MVYIPKVSNSAEIFCVSQGEYHLLLDGEMVRATFNSRGAAMAAIPVERKRREKKKAIFLPPKM